MDARSSQQRHHLVALLGLATLVPITVDLQDLATLLAITVAGRGVHLDLETPVVEAETVVDLLDLEQVDRPPVVVVLQDSVQIVAVLVDLLDSALAAVEAALEVIAMP
jgi:hypothetical protein